MNNAETQAFRDQQREVSRLTAENSALKERVTALQAKLAAHEPKSKDAAPKGGATKDAEPKGAAKGEASKEAAPNADAPKATDTAEKPKA